jgi:hypothetical protein
MFGIPSDPTKRELASGVLDSQLPPNVASRKTTTLPNEQAPQTVAKGLFSLFCSLEYKNAS